MKKQTLLILSFLISSFCFAQSNAIHKDVKIKDNAIVGNTVTIGNKSSDKSAALIINVDDKGFLMEPISTTQRDAIVNPAHGLIIHNLTTDQYEQNIGTPSVPNWKGFIFEGSNISNFTNDAGYLTTETQTISQPLPGVISITDGGSVTITGGADGNGIYDGSGTLSGNTTVNLSTFGLGIGTSPIAGKALTIGGNAQIDGDLTVGVNTLFVNSTLNKISIGGVIGASKLTVYGDLESTTDIIATKSKLHTLGNYAMFSHRNFASSGNWAFGQSQTGQTEINTPAGQPILFRKSAITIAQFDASNNFGIGVVPLAKLHVGGDAQIDGSVLANIPLVSQTVSFQGLVSATGGGWAVGYRGAVIRRKSEDDILYNGDQTKIMSKVTATDYQFYDLAGTNDVMSNIALSTNSQTYFNTKIGVGGNKFMVGTSNPALNAAKILLNSSVFVNDYLFLDKGYFYMGEIGVAVPAPPAGYGVAYPKTDGKLYYKNSAGTEYKLTQDGITEVLTFGGGSSGQVATITVTNGLITSRTLVP